jgi:DNA polymerase-3 subunit alpha
LKYGSLHHHTTFSFMDGYGTPKQHVDRAVELDMPFLAFTEHGNVSSHVQLEKNALKAGIKPIFGVELYTGAVGEDRSHWKWHLTVLAETQKGYSNLLQLVSRGWAEGFHYEPTVSGEMLAEHAEGLIVMSGCLGSKLSTDLIGGKGREEHSVDLTAGIETAERFQDLLGDRYYLEAQTFPELDKTRAINQALEKISNRTGIPLVATGDVHYPKPADSDMQIILHAAGRGNNTFEKQQQSWGYDIKLTSPLTDEMVAKRLRDSGMSARAAAGALAASVEIGARCTVTLPKAERLRFPIPDGYTTASLFRRWIQRGWQYRGFASLSPEDRRSYRDRLKYEMSIIEEKDFADYFLLLSDVVRFAKGAGIPVGPARGSAAASLVCYLLRITEVNPMNFKHMMFERFIDVSRADPPDIDLDFADDRRHEVREYLELKFGKDRVGAIGNFVRYRGKNAVNDVARVYGIPRVDTAIINDLVVERSGGDSRFDASLEDTFEMFPAAKAILDKHPNLAQAVRLEGNLRGLSVHAAGLVVGASPLTDVCAVYTKKSGKDKRPVGVLSIDKYDAEYLDILKIDALGLRTMGMIAICLELAGLTLEDLYAIPLTDQETIEGFTRNDVVGIFQFEGRATRLVNGDVQPSDFSEIADVNALSRPGPLFSGVTAMYTDVKHGRVKHKSLHPVLDPYLDYTKGQIVYQEQILGIIKEVGGFPVTKLAGIRRIISKKLGEGSFQKMFDDFVAGAQERYQIDAKLAETIWAKMVTSAQYSFNIAHAISYSMIAFWCMWLKIHYTAEFYTASLIKESVEKTPRLMKDATAHGLEIRPPDLNDSGITWEPRDGYILAGLSQIPGIGPAQSQVILDDRAEQGEFANWGELLRVKGIGPAKLKTIQDFAGSDDPFDLLRASRMLGAVREAVLDGALPVPLPSHRSDQMEPQQNIQRVRFWGVVRLAEYKDKLEDERARTGKEIEEVRRDLGIKPGDNVKSCTLHAYDDGEEDVYLRFSLRTFPKFRAQLAAIRPDKDVVIVEGRKRRGFGVAIQVTRLWVVDPEVD